MNDLPDMAALAEILGHSPADPALFVEALTHGSHGGKGAKDYQRLEFLGDRVLGLVIAAELYRRFPREQEGQLAARLNGLVTGEVCADVARTLDLQPLVRLGKQARDDGARESDNILGDITEALIGALWLDGGMAPAQGFILANWADRIDSVRAAPKHPKAALMEWAAANRRKTPDYRVIFRDGPDHAPRFTVSVSVNGVGEAQGSGSNKQEAERAAALALLDTLENPS